jgi:hypothetical protein
MKDLVSALVPTARTIALSRITEERAVQYGGNTCLVVRVPGYRTEMYCVSCELRTEFMFYVEESRPPLWSSGQSFRLQIQRSGVDSRRYHIF